MVTCLERDDLLALLCDVFLCFCHFPIWCSGSGVVLDCIDSWSLPSFLLWKVLDKHAPSQDRGLVDIQNVIATGMIQIIKLAELLRPHIQSNNEARTMIADALTLMGQIQLNLSVMKRFLIGPDLKKKYFGLCNISSPLTTKPFWDDVSKDIKNCNSVTYLGKKQCCYKGPRGSQFPDCRG